MEELRPLLPVGYRHVAEAYRRAAGSVTVEQLTSHYSTGLDRFNSDLVPLVIDRLRELSGGGLDLAGWRAFGAGSDVDLMAHVVEGIAARGIVRLFPGDWHGFRVGSTQQRNIVWSYDAPCDLACICVPSVRDGHTTEEMAAWVADAPASLLNLNLYPTLDALERRAVAEALVPALPRALVSISFSRGFGLTASQLGVLLVPPDHPFLEIFEEQWRWLTYFHNAIASEAFMNVDLAVTAAVDDERRAWTSGWLAERGLPSVESGSYYVKSFRPVGEVADHLAPLVRDDVLRLCLKPPIY